MDILCMDDVAFGQGQGAFEDIFQLPHITGEGVALEQSDGTRIQARYLASLGLRKALEQTRYNKTAAAKLLGMSFRQLRYRIKKLGLE